MPVWPFQLLKWYFEDIQKLAGSFFIHMGINAETGVFLFKFAKGAKKPVPNT